MNFIESASKFIETKTQISAHIVTLIILSIFAFILFKIAKKIIEIYCLKFEKDYRKRYSRNQKYNIVLDIFLLVSWYIIWSSYLDKLITIISFISAALTLALREIVFNFFSGIYIKIKKPFNIDDRIQIDNDTIGDVVGINAISFEILEINTKENGEQSTGIIINVPNSYIFNHTIKNYVKEFKYIWDELTIKLPLDANVKKTKNILYKIVNENEIVKSIPKKMQDQIDTISIDYRIYFNKLKPIIYTKIVDNHIEMTIRFLVHPKKMRIVENDIWLNIIEAYNKKQIELFKD